MQPDMETLNETSPPQSGRTHAAVADIVVLSSRQKLGATAFFFLAVVSLRLFMIHLFAVDSPYSDQWDAEGWNLLRMFQNGQLEWGKLFEAHNEHRIVMVRLVSLGLFLLNNGQWDNLVSATFSTLLYATASSLAFRTMLGVLSPLMWPVPAFLLAAGCLPCGFENLLVGFQMEFYLLIILTVTGVWLAASQPVDRKRTLLLGVIAFTCVFSLATGFLASVVVAISAALRRSASREPWLPALPLFAVLGSAAATGFFLLVHAPQHANLQAHDVREWLDALRTVASWPLPVSWLSVATLWAPVAIGGITLIRRRSADPAGIAAVAVGVWTAIQAAGIAYGRAHDMPLHSRYTDMLALGVIVNTLFCLRLLHSGFSPRWPLLRVWIVCLWLTAVAGAYGFQGVVGFKGMQDFAATRQLQHDNVREYLLASNATIINAAMPWNLPYPNKPRLLMFLDDPTIREMLPAGVRKPLSTGAYVNGFSVNGIPPSVAKPKGRGAYGTFAPVKGNDNTAAMNAAGLYSQFPYLLFSVAGDLGSADIGLELEAADGSAKREVVPWASPMPGWREAAASLPSPSFNLLARDDSHDHWFAFTPPVELGRLSYWTHWLLNTSPALVLASWLAAAFAILFLWFLRAGNFHAEPRATSTVRTDARMSDLTTTSTRHADASPVAE